MKKILVSLLLLLGTAGTKAQNSSDNGFSDLNSEEKTALDAIFSKHRADKISMLEELKTLNMKVISLEQENKNLAKVNTQLDWMIKQKDKSLNATKNKLLQTKSEREIYYLKYVLSREERQKDSLKNVYAMMMVQDSLYETKRNLDVERHLTEILQNSLDYARGQAISESFGVFAYQQGGWPIKATEAGLRLDSKNSYKIKTKLIKKITIQFNTGRELDIDVPDFRFNLKYENEKGGRETLFNNEYLGQSVNGQIDFPLFASAESEVKSGKYTLTVFYELNENPVSFNHIFVVD